MQDKITNERIALLHPKVRQEVQAACNHINAKLLGKGVRLRLSQTYRTFKEQAELYAQGRTKKGKIVTQAREGWSVHNYGLAFDIVLLIDKDKDGNFETVSWDKNADFDGDRVADWMEVVLYFKSLGWKWGGDWKSFPDYPHFEKTFGLSLNQMLNKYNEEDSTIQVINDKQYTYINI